MPSIIIGGGRITARISYETEQNIPQNRTEMWISYVEVKSNWGDSGSFWITGSVRINNQKSASLTLGSTYACAVALDSSFSGGGYGWSGWEGSRVTIGHAQDGTAEPVEIRVSLSLQRTSGGGSTSSVSGAQTVELPRIPRTAAMTVTAGELGQEMEILLSNAADSFRNTLVWVCGGQGGTIAQQTEQTRLVWVPPVSLAEEAPENTAVEIRVTVTTYSGEIEAGSRTAEVICGIPASVVPSVTAVISDSRGLAQQYGGYVQNQSRVRIQSAGQGVYGSEIRSVSVACGAVAAAGADVTVIPTDSGNVEITVRVTDSRGRSASLTERIFVQAYSSPKAEVVQLSRCDSMGQLQRDGGFGKIVFSGVGTALAGNTIHYYLSRRIRGTESWTETALTAWDGNFRPEQAEFVFPADIDRDYECRIVVQDDFEMGFSGVQVLSVAFALLDMNRTGRAVGIGQRANLENMLNVGLDMKLYGHRITDLGLPQESGDAVSLETLHILFGVGSCWISAGEICQPQRIVGGRWEKEQTGALNLWKRME